MKPVIIIAIAFVLLIPIPVFAQDVYIYIDDLPEWASYASNVMYLSTEAWKEANEDLEFWVVEDATDSDFRVQWVKEFGGEYVGYALGNKFIEVGLGDSNCLNQWNPYSEWYITHIMKHEIGHIFGHEHDNNPDSIMYPVALNQEYGLVEEEYRLSDGYGQFIPFCTIKDLTSYDFSITTTDETYGFDYYIVPSSNEFDKWAEGGTFQHYSNKDCFGGKWLSISGTCKGVSAGSGIIVIMDYELTSPLETITVTKLEQPNIVNSKSMLTSKFISYQEEFDSRDLEMERIRASLLESEEASLEALVKQVEMERIRASLLESMEGKETSLEALVEQLEQENKQLRDQSEQQLADQRVEEERKEMEKSEIICGTGTIEKDGLCVPDYPDTEPSSRGGGCLIATATYGSELAPQVQQLRELRDNSLLQTESGTSFMESFNAFYYSFSPYIADYERENPVFKEIVKLVITPMVTSLSILNYVDMDSEAEVLGYGISLIVLNAMMYVGIPILAIMRIRK